MADKKPCPNCGHCPTCGHTPQPTVKIIPWPYPQPVYPQPYWQPNQWWYPSPSICTSDSVSTGTTFTINAG